MPRAGEKRTGRGERYALRSAARSRAARSSPATISAGRSASASISDASRYGRRLADTKARCGSARAASASPVTESSRCAYVRSDLSMRLGQAPGGARCAATASGRPGVPRGLLAQGYAALHLIGGGFDQRPRLLVEPPQDISGDDLRVGAVRPPHADPHAPEIATSEPSLHRLEPVVARKPAADAHLDLAERKIDLVVDHEDVIQIHAKRATGRAHRGAGLVHVRLGQQHGDVSALGVKTAVLLLEPGQAEAVGDQLRHLEAHVVARPGVAGSPIAEPHDEPVSLPASPAEEAH